MPQILLLTLMVIPPVEPPERSFRAIQQDIRSSFRQHATANKDEEKVAAVHQMLRLHVEIVGHSKFAESDTLEGYRVQLRSRLKRVEREVQRRANSSRGTAQGARGGRAISDYGPALVDLIERTISPEFWDVHGGPGTIVYYRPLRVLVVRATDDVHHRVGGLLRAW